MEAFGLEIVDQKKSIEDRKSRPASCQFNSSSFYRRPRSILKTKRNSIRVDLIVATINSTQSAGEDAGLDTSEGVEAYDDYD
jgi:hypothetical protein